MILHEAYVTEFEYVKCMCNLIVLLSHFKDEKTVLSDVTYQWAHSW